MCTEDFRHLAVATEALWAKHVECMRSGNCEFYGFPCVTCSHYVFQGKIPPLLANNDLAKSDFRRGIKENHTATDEL